MVFGKKFLLSTPNKQKTVLFNSFDYALFLPIVFGLYWIRFQNSIKWQNSLLLGASFLFYGFWDYRFLALLGFLRCSTIIVRLK